MPKTIEVKRIEVLPTALVLAVVAAVLGLIEGVIVALGAGALIGMAGASQVGIHMVGILAGIASIVIFPIVAFIVTFIVVALAAIIYNFVAERIGGIKFES